MKYLFSFSLTMVATLILLIQTPAQAEIVSAGQPKDVRVKTDPDFRYADIHQRRLDYGEANTLLTEDLMARQKAYVADSIAAQNQYKTDLKNIYDSNK